MLTLRWHALVLSLLVILADRAQAARLVVTIEGLRSGSGDVYVALYSRPDQFPDGAYSDRHQKRPATLDPLTFVFDDLAPGTYALGAYHDENANGKLDTNLIGYPIEGYALSNDIRAVVSRPRFVDAAFILPDSEKRVTLHIRY